MRLTPSTRELAWYDSDQFWERFGAAAFSPARFDQGKVEVAQILDHVGTVRSPARILDMGCGPGRHALELARRGFAVTAVDRTAAFLVQVDRVAAAENLPLVTERGDMSDWRDGSTGFDLALCIGLTFGYLPTAAADARLLAALAGALNPSGVLVLDAATPRWPERDGPWFIVTAPGMNSLVERLPTDAGYVQERWTVRAPDGEQQFAFRQRLYTPDELEASLRAAGFRAVAVYSDKLGGARSEGARKSIAVARR